MASSWRVLPARLDDHVVLFKSDMQDEGYTLHVTDFCIVWSETLTERQITGRAREVSCPIDPEESSSQKSILFREIEAALLDQSACSVKYASTGDVELRMTVHLPPPLAKFTWKFYLRRLPSPSMREEVVLPLVASLYNQKMQMNQLIHFLGEKDNIIGKILDKIDSMGLEYSSVFPNARFAKRGNQRQQVVRSVAGLAPFEKDKWQADSDIGQSGYLKDPASMITDSVSGMGAPAVQAIIRSLLSDDIEVDESPLRSGKHGDASKSSFGNRSEDFEFQRQDTPERMKQTSPKLSVEQLESKEGETSELESPSTFDPRVKLVVDEDDSTTEDEDDLDAPFRSHQSGLPQPLAKFRAQALAPYSPSEASDAYSGPLRTYSAVLETQFPGDKGNDSRNESRASSLRHLKHSPTSDEQTESESEEHPQELDSPHEKRQQLRNKSLNTVSEERPKHDQEDLPRRKIGQIGGRPLDEESSLQADDRPDRIQVRDSFAEPASPSIERKKIGRIGGSRPKSGDDNLSSSRMQRQSKTFEVDAADPTKRSVAVGSFTPPKEPYSANDSVNAQPDQNLEPEEEVREPTVKEKADLKREQLRKEMEQAKPVVKRRRKF